jgi:hypothetical protein
LPIKRRRRNRRNKQRLSAGIPPCFSLQKEAFLNYNMLLGCFLQDGYNPDVILLKQSVIIEKKDSNKAGCSPDKPDLVLKYMRRRYNGDKNKR